MNKSKNKLTKYIAYFFIFKMNKKQVDKIGAYYTNVNSEKF